MVVKFSGSISGPSWSPSDEVYVQGSIIVYPNSAYGITIGGEVIQSSAFEFTLSSTREVGTCKIEIVDGGGIYKQLIDAKDEIRIFVKPEYATHPVFLFRGNVQDVNYIQHKGQITTITGVSIEQKLFDVTITKDYVNEDIVDIVKDLLDEQPVFIQNDLPTITGKKITISFEKENIFTAIHKVIAPFNYRFFAETDYKVYLYAAANIPISTDSIELGDITTVSDVKDTQSFYNRAVIQGKDSSISSTENDEVAQDKYDGIIDYFAILPDLQTEADTTAAAKNIITNYANPIKKYTLVIKPIYYTRAGYRLEIEFPDTDLDSSYYEIKKIKFMFMQNDRKVEIEVNSSDKYFEDLILDMSQGLTSTMKKTFA